MTFIQDKRFTIKTSRMFLGDAFLGLLKSWRCLSWTLRKLIFIPEVGFELIQLVKKDYLSKSYDVKLDPDDRTRWVKKAEKCNKLCNHMKLAPYTKNVVSYLNLFLKEKFKEDYLNSNTHLFGEGKDGTTGDPSRNSGGGGGSGSAGSNTTSTGGGNGGAGKEFISYFGTNVGHNGWFAGGGGGNTFGTTGNPGYANGGNGILGGIGNGGFDDSNNENNDIRAGEALPHTGGGGGGSKINGGTTEDLDGGDGGSGIVIIQYKTTKRKYYNI